MRITALHLHSRSAGRRGASGLVAICCLAAVLPAAPAGAVGTRLHPRAVAQSGEAARIDRFWTAGRMRATPPLDARPGEDLLAGASFAPVANPTVPPYTVNGRLFIRQEGEIGYCSATAIDSPSHRLVLTAGHCLNTGPRKRHRGSAWSSFVKFVPAYAGSAEPFGGFVAYRAAIFAPRQWVKFGNPNFDIGAVVTRPNEDGVNVADAVGGGVAIATDLSYFKHFYTFGYPGESRHMQGCESDYTGRDPTTTILPGPSTIAIHCHWAAGASGGGWLIESGARIDGLTSYGHPGDRVHTFGPYFSRRNVGHLVAGL